MKFIFNGDRLSYVDIRVTDMATSVQTSIYSVSEDDSGGHLPIYNSEEFITTTNVPYLQNGHDYVWQVMLAQRNLSGADNLYDIPVCRGSVVFDSVSGTSLIAIEPNLPIYEWGYNGNDETSYPTGRDNVIYAGMVIEINGERRFIQSYKPKVAYGDGKYFGQITVQSPFTNLPQEGDRYQIMSNYLISPQYYFMSRELPSLTLSMEFGSKGNNTIDILVSGTYSQSNNTPIKYYSIDLYSFVGNVSDPSATLYKLAESGKIFSQKIDFTFKYCNAAFDMRVGELADSINYRAICTIVTQDNVVYSAYVSMSDTGVEETSPVTRDFEWTPNKHYGCTMCNYSTVPSDATILQYRKDLNSGKVVQLPLWYYDFTVSTKGRYDYITIYRNALSPYETYLESTTHYEVETNLDGYYITALEPIAYEKKNVNNKNVYMVGDTWKFICDIDNTTIVQNMNKTSHVGYSRYPSVSSTNLNYLSGTLSGMIGSLNCCNKKYRDDISLVNEWRDFISQPHPFLLKTQKGDVLIVNIEDNPKTEYQEDYHLIPTRFTINWSECDNIDDAKIYCDRELDDGECPETHIGRR